MCHELSWKRSIKVSLIVKVTVLELNMRHCLSVWLEARSLVQNLFRTEGGLKVWIKEQESKYVIT
jgi:hypothetical protein